MMMASNTFNNNTNKAAGLFRKASASLLAAALVLSLSACGGSSNAPSGEDTSLSDIQKKGELVVGMNAEFAPYEFHAMIDGEDKIIGMDIDIAQALADDMGVTLRIQEMTMDGLIVGLNAGQVDILISGLSATEARREQIDFSIPYYKSSMVALINKKDADQYKTLEDLRDKRLGVQLSSLQQQVVDKTFPDANVTLIESMNTLFLALKSGQVDAIPTADIVCKMAIANNPEFAIAEGSTFDTTFLGSPGAAVGMRKGSTALEDQINATLTRIIESGELDRFLAEACIAAAENQGA